MKEQLPSAYYLAPRPAFKLEPLRRAIYLTLRDARGIFRSAGMSATVLRNTLVRGSDALAEAISVEYVESELRALQSVGLVEQLASNKENWRAKR